MKKEVIFKFHINKDTGQPHILDHEVYPEEIKSFFIEKRYIPMDRSDGSIEADGVVNGRFLKVAYRIEEDGSYFIITAYDISDSKLRNLLNEGIFMKVISSQNQVDSETKQPYTVEYVELDDTEQSEINEYIKASIQRDKDGTAYDELIQAIASGKAKRANGQAISLPIKDEYNIDELYKLGNPVQAKYAHPKRKTYYLDDDLLELYPTSESVNNALRALAQTGKAN